MVVTVGREARTATRKETHAGPGHCGTRTRARQPGYGTLRYAPSLADVAIEA
ncbi:hypothetical protein GCM10010399_38100 [Dactylosporangium fulvum]